MTGRNHFLGISVLAFGLATGACSGDPNAASSDEDNLTEVKLEVARTSALPIAEVSGLGRRTISGKTSFLAVPDAEATLVTFDLDSKGKASSIKKHDLSALFASRTPQWEAVAGDSSGAVFILGEASDQISVLDEALEKVVHTIKLEVPDGHSLSKDWKNDANSHGEGMILLSNGHILVVKEKDPVALIEFAVKGQRAEGYTASLSLGDRAFKLPEGSSSTMTPVHHWLLKSSQTKDVSDVSELALDRDGRLLLLTDQGRGIAVVERNLRPDEDKMDIKSIYTLPSEVDKPEGLIVVSGVPLVAIDQPKDGDSLFTLTPLP